MIAGNLAAGIGIHATADIFNHLDNFLRITVLCALEHHVFNHMCDAVMFARFMPRPNASPNTQRNRLHIRNRISNNPQAIFEGGEFYL